MFVARKDFKSYKHGSFKKGDEAPHKSAWIEAGLIEEATKKPSPKMETKPEPKKKKADK